MSLDNTELLTAEEIEERIANTFTAIINISKKMNTLTMNLSVPDKDYKSEIGELNKNLKKLRIDHKAYQTALNTDPFDYY